MHVRELGAGRPVLLLHGTPSPAADWMPLAERLSTRHRVLVPDLPGYGASGAPRGTSVEAVDDEIAAMLRQRGARELRAIVGYSGGAYRAFDLLLRGQATADRIVSLAGFAAADDATRAGWRELARAIRDDAAYLSGPAMRGTMAELMLSPRWRDAHPADVERVASWTQLTSPAALAAELEMFAAARDLRPELARLRSPIYLRVGEHDAAAPVPQSQDIQSHARRATLEVVPGCGHGLLIEDLAATIDAVVAFVAT
jgi:3-oxoadipate enol-lactonase